MRNKAVGSFIVSAVIFTLAINLAAQEAATLVTTLPTGVESQKAFSVSLFSLGGFTDKQFRQADPSMDFFDNYLSFNYKISRDLKISARPAFGYSTAGRNIFNDIVTDKIRTRDFSIVAKISNLLENVLPADLDLSNAFRLFFPSSDASRDQGMIARLRYEIEGKSNFNKSLGFRYYAKPSYYFQNSTTYLDNSNPKKPNAVKTTSKIDLEHGGEFNFDMNQYFSLKPGFEFQEKWSNSSADLNKPEIHLTGLRTGLGLEIRPNRDMNFTIGIQDSRDLIFMSKPAETGYTLMTNITMF